MYHPDVTLLERRFPPVLRQMALNVNFLYIPLTGMQQEMPTQPITTILTQPITTIPTQPNHKRDDTMATCVLCIFEFSV